MTMVSPDLDTSVAPKATMAVCPDNEHHDLADPEKSLILWF